jgi:hypothetical protein
LALFRVVKCSVSAVQRDFCVWFDSGQLHNKDAGQGHKNDHGSTRRGSNGPNNREGGDADISGSGRYRPARYRPFFIRPVKYCPE